MVKLIDMTFTIMFPLTSVVRNCAIP